MARTSKAALAERRSRALAMKVAGATNREIGAALGISHTQAYRDVKHQLDALAESDMETAARYRQVAIRRFEGVIRVARAVISDPQSESADRLAAADRITRAQTAINRLYGLDAPKAVETTVAVKGVDPNALAELGARIMGGGDDE